MLLNTKYEGKNHFSFLMIYILQAQLKQQRLSYFNTVKDLLSTKRMCRVLQLQN